MVNTPSGGGGVTDASMAPFDRHPAQLGEIGNTAERLERLAGRAVDLREGTDRQVRPAEESWDGIAAPELQAAPVGVRRDAAQSSDAMVWLAGTLWYWRRQVEEFNNRVGTIAGERAEARTNRWGVPPGDEFAYEAALAQQEHERRMRERWWQAHSEFIDEGSRTAATMLRQGPTAEHLQLLSEAGVWRSPSGAVEVFMPLWHDQAMRQVAGDALDLAERVNDPNHQPTHEELIQLEQILAEYAEDEAFSYYFFTELGAEGTLLLSGNLAFLVTDHPEMRDDDLASTVGAIQASLGVALATATARRGTGGDHPYAPYVPGQYELDSDWRIDLLTAGRTQYEFGSRAGRFDGYEGHTFPGPFPVYGYQLLGPLLHHGDYDESFLGLVGGDMIDFERANGGSELWRTDHPGGIMFDGMRIDWSNGWERTQPAGFDPMIGLMSAMERNPEGALAALTGQRTFGDYPDYASPPPDGYRLGRVDYLLTDREWLPDYVIHPENIHFFSRNQELVANPGLATFGSVLEGATALDDPRAVMLVESIVYELNVDEVAMGYANGEEVGDGQSRAHIDNDLMHPVLRESIGNIMADYIWDVNRSVDAVGSAMPGGRGAQFSETHIIRLLADLGKDEGAHETLREAQAVYAAASYDYYLSGQADLDPDNLSDRIAAAENTARRYGAVMGALDYGAITQDWHDQLQADNQHNNRVETNFMVAGFVVDQVAGQTVGKVPVAGNVANMFIGGVLDAAKQDAMVDNSGLVTYGVGETLSDGRSAAADLAMASLYHSGELPLLPEELTDGGEPIPISQWGREEYAAWENYLDNTGQSTAVALGNGAADHYDNGVRRANETLNNDVFNSG